MNEPFGAGLAANQPAVRVGPLSDAMSVPLGGDVEEIGRTSLVAQLAITLLAVGFILGYTWWMVVAVAVPAVVLWLRWEWRQHHAELAIWRAGRLMR
jgi:hypothetical protein